MMKSVLAIVLCVCLLPGVPASADDARPADSALTECTEKVDVMPDLCQTDEAFRSLPYQGKYSCGPTAVANVLVALDQRGFDHLVEGDVGSKAVQRALLEQLSAKPYLETTRHGIGPIGIMSGLDRFIRARGYHAEFEWKGWRHGGDFATGRFVDLAWLREGVSGESNVVLNIGWYRRDEEKDLYSRLNGHYMTLVGYRRQGDDFTYLIHDPAARSGPGKVTHEARLVPIPGGRLAPWKSYGQRSAEGHFLIEGIVVKSTADAAILDGAIRVTIAKPP
ncbi:MAG TPA: hypothetical protein VMY37_01170 [Thermoguttaceae bacterium]|nr:hypothetical protein [Thermoguttaceae bacterium]